MGGFSMGGIGDWFSGAADAGSNAEWDMFDNADFDSIGNSGISSNAGSAMGGIMSGARNGIEAGMFGGGDGQFVPMGKDAPPIYMGDTSGATTPDSSRFIKDRYKDMSGAGNVASLIGMLKSSQSGDRNRTLKLPPSMLNDLLKQGRY